MADTTGALADRTLANGTPTAESAAITDDAVGEQKSASNVETPAKTVRPSANEDTTEADGAQVPSNESAEATVQAPAGPVNGKPAATPASSKKSKRKSGGSQPASGKKLKNKKSMLDLHLNVQPGEYWYVRMKGYANWPAIICDEEMLPESLLERRPVSAIRPDGQYREDFADGGKNVRDRRYAVMFLGTNEFGWHVNTDLLPLDVDEIKELVEHGDQGKKSKALWEAYKVAAEGHDIDYFKDMLNEHEQMLRDEHARVLEEETKRQVKKEKKDKKVVVDEDGDLDMDVDEPVEKKKPSKKRKKDVDVEESKGKTKIVLKGLKIVSDGDVEPEPKKPRKQERRSVSEDEPKPPAEPQVSPEEMKKRKEKTILYLRHKLQKGLVSRDSPPKPEEMDAMAEHLTSLESFRNVEADSIRETKVNKLMKVILRTPYLPRDEEFKFKERCEILLKIWTGTLKDDEASREAEKQDGPSAANEEAKTEDQALPSRSSRPEPEAAPAAENENASPAED